MVTNVFTDLKEHYQTLAESLRAHADEAGVLRTSSDVGTQREDLYKSFLERHLPKSADVFLGGYVFGMDGQASQQIDVVITTGIAPRFRLRDGNRFIAPLEGTIGIAEVKSRLDKASLHDALYKCASIPAMPEKGNTVPPFLKVSDTRWNENPFKIIFAYDSIAESSLMEHIDEFYAESTDIPFERRPHMIHVLGKYSLMRMTSGWQLESSAGVVADLQPAAGEFIHLPGDDVAAIMITLQQLQQSAFAFNGNYIAVSPHLYIDTFEGNRYRSPLLISCHIRSILT
ncbi:MAG: hypothetical protein OXI33_00965 [Chloroflexota bacterium]|nr:hypothetical protein [Chloroflexota bacterium]